MNNRKNTIFIIKGVLFFLLFLNTIFVIGQHDHSSDLGLDSFVAVAPHGGELIKSGKYTIEMLANPILKEDKLSFYVYKSSMKLLPNEEINGTIEIKFKDGTIVNETLEKREGSQFVAQIESATSFHCIVSFIIKGKIYKAEFNYTIEENSKVSIYSCPMHPEIQKDSTGTCPKCGMKLRKEENY